MWGLPEAALGWLAGLFLPTLITAVILSTTDWKLFRPSRPGGNVGNAAGRLGDGREPGLDSIPFEISLLTNVSLWVGLLAIPVALAAFAGKERRGWNGGFDASDLSNGVLAGVLLQIPVIPLVYFVIQEVTGPLVTSDQALSITDQAQTPLQIGLLVFIIAIGAPVVEELFYRGLVQTALVDRYGEVIGIGIASLIFGAVHFSIVRLPALVLVGAVTGVLAHRSGRLAPAIIAHMTFNTFTLVSLFAARA